MPEQPPDILTDLDPADERAEPPPSPVHEHRWGIDLDGALCMFCGIRLTDAEIEAVLNCYIQPIPPGK